MDITADCQQLQRGIESRLYRFDPHADANRLILQLRTLVPAPRDNAAPRP